MKHQRKSKFDEIRIQVAQESLSGMKTGYIARKYGVSPTSVRKWTQTYKETIGVENLPTVSERVADAKRLEELEHNYAIATKMLGEKELELEILRELLKKTNPVSMKK